MLLAGQRVALLEFPELRVSDGGWHHLLVAITSSKEGKDTKYMAQVSLDYDVVKVCEIRIGRFFSHTRITRSCKHYSE